MILVSSTRLPLLELELELDRQMLLTIKLLIIQTLRLVAGKGDI